MKSRRVESSARELGDVRPTSTQRLTGPKTNFDKSAKPAKDQEIVINMHAALQSLRQDSIRAPSCLKNEGTVKTSPARVSILEEMKGRNEAGVTAVSLANNLNKNGAHVSFKSKRPGSIIARTRVASVDQKPAVSQSSQPSRTLQTPKRHFESFLRSPPKQTVASQDLTRK